MLIDAEFDGDEILRVCFAGTGPEMRQLATAAITAVQAGATTLELPGLAEVRFVVDGGDDACN